MLNRSFSVFTCVESLFGLGSVCLLPFLCLTWSFFSHRRVFRSKLENWKAKPAPAAQASPRSPCMPFSWFNESRKGSYSFRNLPSVPSPLLPSPETLVSDKTGSKVDNWTKKKKKLSRKLRFLSPLNFWKAFSTCVYTLGLRSQCANTAIGMHGVSWRGEMAYLTRTLLILVHSSVCFSSFAWPLTYRCEISVCQLSHAGKGAFKWRNSHRCLLRVLLELALWNSFTGLVKIYWKIDKLELTMFNMFKRNKQNKQKKPTGI